MTKIEKTVIPACSLLHKEDKVPGYSDSYKAVFRPAHKPVTPADLGKAFFSASPQ